MRDTLFFRCPMSSKVIHKAPIFVRKTAVCKKTSNNILICGKPLEMKDDLLYHCKECDKSFKLKSSYKLHQRIYMEKISCQLCGSEFARNSGLSRHIKHIHGY